MSKPAINIVEESTTGLMMPEYVAQAIGEQSKGLPEDFKYTRKAVAPKLEFGLEDGSRTDVSTISTNDPDMEGEVIIPAGMNLDLLNQHKQVFFAHNYKSLPVGRVVWAKANASAVVAKTAYFSKPQGHTGDWMPDAIFSIMQQGGCQGKSVGFLPLNRRGATADEVTKCPSWKGKLITDKCAAFEYSVAPLAMNPNAMVLAVSKCVTDQALRDELLSASGIDAKAFEQAIEEVIEVVEKAVEPPAPVKTAEELAAEELTAKRAKAMDIIVPFVEIKTLHDAQKTIAQRQVDQIIKESLDDIFARAQGRP